MAAKSKSQIARERQMREQGGFDITCTIGRVEFGADEDSPYLAAMRIIAEHTEGGAEGHFEFPNEVGDTMHITVERELYVDPDVAAQELGRTMRDPRP